MAGLDPAIHRAGGTMGDVHTSFNNFWHTGAMGGWVYIVTNKRNGTLYTGVTSNIARSAWELALIEASSPAWNDLYEHVGAV